MVLMPLLKFAIFYLSVNFVQTKVSGEPVYTFLKWDGFGSALICIAIILINAMIYIILCKIDENIKWESFVKKSLNDIKKNKEIK